MFMQLLLWFHVAVTGSRGGQDIPAPSINKVVLHCRQTSIFVMIVLGMEGGLTDTHIQNAC